MSEPTFLDRLLTSVRQIIADAVAPTRYFGRYEFTVTSASGGGVPGQDATVSGSPTDLTLGLDDVANVPIRSGLLGDSVTPTVGATFDVMFINGDPARPVVVGASAVDSASIAGTLGNPAARLGDQVVVFLAGVPFQISAAPVYAGVTGLVDGMSAPVTAPAGFVYLIAQQPITGIINNGSAKVTVD